jgi:hypothetical protein
MISIIDQVMGLLFFLLWCIAMRLHAGALPFTAACSPLLLILVQRYIWHRSFLKAFKSPQDVVKYLVQLMIINIVLNFSLQADNLVNFSPIALLWPCYGLIAISFLFFAVSLLLFINAACS